MKHASLFNIYAQLRNIELARDLVVRMRTTLRLHSDLYISVYAYIHQLFLMIIGILFFENSNFAI